MNRKLGSCSLPFLFTIYDLLFTEQMIYLDNNATTRNVGQAFLPVHTSELEFNLSETS